jgi:hypothetical protein
MALRTRKNALNPKPSLFRNPLRVGALGLLAGLASACVVSIHDGWSDAKEECFDDYDDCMDDIHGPGDAAACEAVLDACLEACDAGDDDAAADTDDDGPGDGDGDDDEDPPRAETGDGDGDGDEPDPACFTIHATCVAEAQTLQDIEACEALFDNCIDPGPCESEACEPGCPQAQLDACVSGYADCAAGALTPEDVIACEASFDGCVAEFDVGLCLPNYDDDLVLECVEQHELCVACADDAGELAACKMTFDNCLEG